MASSVVIITGASRGIGMHAAQTLVKASHKVVLTARTEGPMQELKASYPSQVAYLAGDMNDYSFADTLVKFSLDTFGKLDGLIVNHGVLEPMTRLENASVNEWKKLYNINFFSGLALLKATIPALRDAKGCVVWVSSGAATSCYTAWGAYGSSKAALNSLSGHLAVEEPDITSIAISPGRVDTEMQRLLRDAGDEMKPTDRQSFVDAFEKGELVKPEMPGAAIARFVVYPTRELSGKFLKCDFFGLPNRTWLTDVDRLTAPELASYMS